MSGAVRLLPPAGPAPPWAGSGEEEVALRARSPAFPSCPFPARQLPAAGRVSKEAAVTVARRGAEGRRDCTGHLRRDAGRGCRDDQQVRPHLCTLQAGPGAASRRLGQAREPAVGVQRPRRRRGLRVRSLKWPRVRARPSPAQPSPAQHPSWFAGAFQIQITESQPLSAQSFGGARRAAPTQEQKT